MDEEMKRRGLSICKLDGIQVEDSLWLALYAHCIDRLRERGREGERST